MDAELTNVVQYPDKFIDMCVSKVMTGEEKSQRRAVEPCSPRVPKEVLTVLSVSTANTNPASSQRSSAETPNSNSASTKGALKDDAAKEYEQQGGCRLSASLKVNSWKSSTRLSV